MTHEMTIQEHIEHNLAMAIDQAGQFEENTDGIAQWFEGDAYSQNTFDSVVEDGYTRDQAWEARLDFDALARKTTIRFA